MTQIESVLLAAAIGAASGVVAGLAAATASLRASQLASRAPIVDMLHQLGTCLVDLEIARAVAEDSGATDPSNDGQVVAADRTLQKTSAALYIHQRVLCPSERIHRVIGLILEVAADEALGHQQSLHYSSQLVDAVALMISAHSQHLFHWRAELEEPVILKQIIERGTLPEAIWSRLAAIAWPPIR